MHRWYAKEVDQCAVGIVKWWWCVTRAASTPRSLKVSFSLSVCVFAAYSSLIGCFLPFLPILVQLAVILTLQDLQSLLFGEFLYLCVTLFLRCETTSYLGPIY